MHLRPALPQIHEELTEDRVVGIRRYALLLEPRPKGIGKLPLGVAAYLIPSGSLPEPYVSVPIDRWIQVQPLMRGCVVEGDICGLAQTSHPFLMAVVMSVSARWSEYRNSA